MKIGISIVVMLVGIFAVVSCTQLALPNANATQTLPTASPAIPTAPQVAPATPLPPTVAPTATPVPTITLPTVTPSPAPDPDANFLNWLSEHQYQFLVDVTNGSKRYDNPDSEKSIVIDVNPESVLAWQIAFDDTEEMSTLLDSADVIIAAIEAHGLDSEPVRAALAAPHQFPLSLQVPGYIFLLEKEDHKETNIWYSTIKARVTFSETN